MIVSEIKTLLGVIAPVIEATGDAVYVKSILWGRTRPHLFSWLVWIVMLTIVFAGQVVSGAGPGAWLTGYRVVATIAIIGLALFKGDKSCTKGDLTALVAASIGIVFWSVSKDATWTICLETAISVVLWYPKFRKVYSDPYSEPPTAYILFGIPNIIQLFAIETYGLATMIYPAASLIVSVSFVSMCYWRRSVIHNN